MPANPHAVDVHVGRKVREQRVALGLTQADLATALGLTFQQVQKYERGANRISASKLWQIAETLDTAIDTFFAGLPIIGPEPGSHAEQPPPNAQAIEMGRRARQLTQPCQRLVLEFMREWLSPDRE